MSTGVAVDIDVDDDTDVQFPGLNLYAPVSQEEGIFIQRRDRLAMRAWERERVRFQRTGNPKPTFFQRIHDRASDILWEYRDRRRVKAAAARTLQTPHRLSFRRKSPKQRKHAASPANITV
ncbi:cis-Golgi t-SNARE syntaxin [Ascosphaera pollenicola]|nr:cis-Golgi t-SNARE syntaxin [Ascosphaera pollenicola]